MYGIRGAPERVNRGDGLSGGDVGSRENGVNKDKTESLGRSLGTTGEVLSST